MPAIGVAVFTVIVLLIANLVPLVVSLPSAEYSIAQIAKRSILMRHYHEGPRKDKNV